MESALPYAAGADPPAFDAFFDCGAPVRTASASTAAHIAGTIRRMVSLLCGMLGSEMLRQALFTVSLIAAGVYAAAPEVTTWRFTNTASLGGHKTTILGHPKAVKDAIEFNGIDDALFLDVHPLAGAETFTWEVIFRPDSGGKPEQRFFHFQERGTENRMLFEI